MLNLGKRAVSHVREPAMSLALVLEKENCQIHVADFILSQIGNTHSFSFWPHNTPAVLCTIGPAGKEVWSPSLPARIPLLRIAAAVVFLHVPPILSARVTWPHRVPCHYSSQLQNHHNTHSFYSLTLQGDCLSPALAVCCANSLCCVELSTFVCPCLWSVHSSLHCGTLRCFPHNQLDCVIM